MLETGFSALCEIVMTLGQVGGSKILGRSLNCDNAVSSHISAVLHAWAGAYDSELKLD